MSDDSAAEPQAELVQERGFAELLDMLSATYGFDFREYKEASLARRIRARMSQVRADDFVAYAKYVGENPNEHVALFNTILINVTGFFRDPEAWKVLAADVIPRVAAAAEESRSIRIWSAGCSSGEEPFSLAMVLLALCPPEHGWEVEIEATDISTKVLRRAEEAVWPQERAAHIPDRYLKRFMLRGVRSQQGKVKASPELRRLVRFERLNLMSGGHSGMGRFDLILCRNVLIYFDAASKARALKGLLERLAPGGHLFVGHSETLVRIAPTLRPVCPNVYKLEDAAAA
jgi:chemotaxis protein methyltransferase CheR